MIFNVTGGGGTSLNFKVVGGTTQPTSPKENTIWVNTSVAIPSWAFSATEPESPVAGMVWFATGKSSPAAFNALRKNTITVCPLDVKQYVGGQWTRVEAKTYQNGAWVSWITYLYNHGDECTDLTGGWEISNNCGGTIQKNNDNITLVIKGVTAKDTYGIVNTVNPVDLSDYSELTINDDWLVSTSGPVGTYTNPRFGVTTAKPRSKSEVVSPTAYISGGNSLDVSSLTGEYYIFVGAAFNGTENYKAEITIAGVFAE